MLAQKSVFKAKNRLEANLCTTKEQKRENRNMRLNKNATVGFPTIAFASVPDFYPCYKITLKSKVLVQHLFGGA